MPNQLLRRLALTGALLLPGVLQATAVTTPVSGYFDPPASGQTVYSDNYRVAGSITPATWSWGRIELLEGYQKFRTEGYNYRSEKLRYQDTWQSLEYPTRTYFGDLNQQLVDGFNTYYHNSCASPTSAVKCPDPGPTRPEARFVLLHVGPKTAAGQCDKTRTPMLLVHGSAVDANTWLWPFGNDGRGNIYPGFPEDLDGMAFALEADGICTFAVTFGNFHGDNFGQATHVANSIRRVKAITGASQVDLLTWSKGALAVDAYLMDAAKWNTWGTSYFEQIAAAQAKEVPAYKNDVRGYFSVSGAHLGIDESFRHPFVNLAVPGASENLGRGPIVWGRFMAMQCVTWGYASSPDSPYWPDPLAYSICENRGATWPDFWSWIYTSNITSLDAQGHPVYNQSLKTLNTRNGASSTAYTFDAYNIAMWGSVDDAGKLKIPYQGQLQAAWDFRGYYDVEYRDHVTQDWTGLDFDEYNWYDWLDLKLGYDPTAPGNKAGVMLDNKHVDCRATAYEPDVFPCLATHTQVNRRTAESIKNGVGTYKLFDGIGIDAAREMGGYFVDRLREHSLPPLKYVYVLYGTQLNTTGVMSEIDGMDCPTCQPHSDGVVFDVSIQAQAQLTRGWDAAYRTAHSSQAAVATNHLAIGVHPDTYTLLLNKLHQIDGM